MHVKPLLRFAFVGSILSLVSPARTAWAQYTVGLPFSFAAAPSIASIAPLDLGGAAGGKGVVFSTGTTVAVQQLTPTPGSVLTLTLPSSITSVGYVSVADADNDGQADVIVSASNTALVVIYYQNAGTVATTAGASVSTFPVTFRPGKVAAADLDGNGRRELVTYDASTGTTGNNSIALIAGTSSRGYGTPSIISRPNPSGTGRPTVYGVIVADFNRDTKPDVLLDYGSPRNVVGYSQGTGTTTQLLTESYPIYGGAGLVSADFDRDGSPDLAYVRTAGGVERLYLALTLASAGSGNFAQTSGYILPAPVLSMVAADVDGDGLLDLAALHSTGATVIRNNGNYSTGFLLPYYTGTNLPTVGTFFGLAATELNGDNRADFLLLNSNRGTGQLDQLLPLLSQPANPTATRPGRLDAPQLYPNPSAGTFRLSTPTTGKVRVYDVMGRNVASATVGGVTQLAVPTPGMYWVEWNDGTTHCVKWLVQ